MSCEALNPQNRNYGEEPIMKGLVLPWSAWVLSVRRRKHSSAPHRLLRCGAAMMLLACGSAALAGFDGDEFGLDERGSAVQTWATGQISPLTAAKYNNQTIREIVPTSIGGDVIRVRISNTFGTAPLVIGAAHIAVAGSNSSIVPGTDRVLTFGGRTQVSIPPGAPAVSDPVHLHVMAVSDLAVSIYLPSATRGETTTFFQGSSYVSMAGNYAGAIDLAGATAISEWPFVSGISVMTHREGGAVVALTDSATLVSQWPAALAARLDHVQIGDLAVVSAAVAGNRLLFNSADPAAPNPQWGQSVLTRFDRDVLGQAGVETVIVWIGLNDLAGPGSFYPPSEQVSVDDVTVGLLQLIERAHQYGLKILGCTISPMGGNTSLPGFDTPAHEAARVALNTWIRTSKAFDGVIDADLVLRDPSQPTRLLPAYDSGDHLHPNTTGGQAIAKAIDLRLVLIRH
jgi:lysophospholipase L1-like esterase